MRGCCFADVKKVNTIELADPRIDSDDQAIVQVHLAGLCGSDLHPWFGREQGLDPGTVMGHEFVGVVRETGPSVKNIRVGDRVACPFSTSCGQCFFCQRGLTSRCERGQLFGWRQNGQGLHGGQAEYVLVPDADGSLVRIDETVSDKLALLIGDNLSTAWYCADMANISPDGVYLIVGCGTVGLLTLLAARSLGAEAVFVFDPDPTRIRRAESFGARAFDDPYRLLTEIRLATGNRGADAVMELVGLPDAQALGYQAIRPGGILSTIGCHCTPHFAFSPVQAYDKNLTYRTGRCPARFYMDRLLEKSAEFLEVADSVITHRFPVTESQRAYEVFSQHQDGCLKAAFDFH